MLGKRPQSVQDATAAESLPAECKPRTHTHTCKHTRGPCLHQLLLLLSSLCCSRAYLRWHIHKPPDYVHPSVPASPLAHLWAQINFLRALQNKIKMPDLTNWESSQILRGEAIKWARQRAEENRSTCTHRALGGSTDKSLSQVCKQIVLILLLWALETSTSVTDKLERYHCLKGGGIRGETAHRRKIRFWLERFCRSEAGRRGGGALLSW